MECRVQRGHRANRGGMRGREPGQLQWRLMVRLETVLDSWKTIRQDTAQAVEDCPAGELDFRPMPDLMTFREIARHILNASLGLTGLMLDGETNLATPAFREKMKPHFSTLPENAEPAALA